jgi:hypothetical protein
MPRGPNGEKRPADVVGCAITVAKIATGEIEEDLPEHRDARVSAGKARSDSMSSEERSELAKTAARARWDGNREERNGNGTGR